MVTKPRLSSYPSQSSVAHENSSKNSAVTNKDEKKESSAPARSRDAQELDQTPSLKQSIPLMIDSQSSDTPSNESSSSAAETDLDKVPLPLVANPSSSNTQASAGKTQQESNGVVWNVNSIRKRFKQKMMELILRRQGLDFIVLTEARITKAQWEKNQLTSKIQACNNGYKVYTSLRNDRGYCGVVLICKETPIKVISDFGDSEFASEGRVLTAEFKSYILISVYSPFKKGKNAEQMKEINKFDEKLQSHAEELKKKYPQKKLILTGDLNTESISKRYSKLLALGFVDTFKGSQSFGTKVGKSKRIDYCLILDNQAESGEVECTSSIYGESKLGSDHYPQKVCIKV